MEIKEFYTLVEVGETMGISEQSAETTCRNANIEILVISRSKSIRRVDLEKLLGHPIGETPKTNIANPAELTPEQKAQSELNITKLNREKQALLNNYASFDAEKESLAKEKTDFESQKQAFQTMQSEYSDYEAKKEAALDAIKRLADAKQILVNASTSAEAIRQKAKLEADALYNTGKAKLDAENEDLIYKIDRATKDLTVRIQLYGDNVQPSINAITDAYNTFMAGLQKKMSLQQVYQAISTDLQTLSNAKVQCTANEDYQNILSLIKKKSGLKIPMPPVSL
jgi:hypothetical protein